MILLAFFSPVAIYLLVLGVLNRHRHPLLVSGVWDGIGLLFGVSGFLLFAGPAVFSSINERWRLYWLLGKGGVPVAGPGGAWQFWVFLSILYFLLVVLGSALLLWKQRQLTAVYNAEAAQIELVLTQLCADLGLNPLRSGGLFVFGLSSLSPADAVLEQTAILEMDSFALMRHVTLRWDPANCPLRQVVETELERRLAETPARENLLGGWLLTLGCLLLAFEFLGASVLVVVNTFLR